MVIYLGPLIAQGLKRPHPPRLWTPVLQQSKCERAAHIPRIVQRRRDLFGLAPGGVYQATPITQGTGGLLPRLFNLTHRNSVGGICSVALSLSRLGGTVRVTDHLALWSSDFPPLTLLLRRRSMRSDHLFSFVPPFRHVSFNRLVS